MKKLISLFVISAFLFTLVPLQPAVADNGNDAAPNYGFIPNSGEASVSKVNLVDGTAVARYWTAPRQGQEVDAFGEENPGIGFPIAPFDWRAGRIGLDLQGNAWSINTGADCYTGSGLKGYLGGEHPQGTIARIQLNTSGLTTTNNDHSVPLAFGIDEAVQVFAVGGPGDIPRAVNFTADGTAWIGFHMAHKKNGYYAQFEYDDSGATPTFEPTGKIVESTPEWDLAPYNATIDKNGRLWFVSYGSTHLRRNPGNTYGANNGVYSFDTTSADPQTTLVKYEGITSGYGILIDNTPEDVIVYVTILESNNTLFALNTVGGNVSFASINIPNTGGPRGMAFDDNGVIWIAASSDNRVSSYNPDGGATASYTGFSTRPVGVGKDAQGKMWVVIRNDGNATGMIRGFNPADPTTTNDIGLGNRPYAYADFVIPPVLEEDLTVTKTAVTSYVREHLWDIEKHVETENEHTIGGEQTPKIWLYTDGSGDETATWHVDVTYKGYEDSDHNVSGEITIENTGDLDAVITGIDDVLDGTAIDVDCGVTFPYTLPVGQTLTCNYSEDIKECPHQYVLNITSINNNTGFTHVFTINYDPVTGTISGSGDSPHAGSQTLSEFYYTLDADGNIDYIKFRSDYDLTGYFWFPAFYLNEDGTLTYYNVGGDNVWNAEGTWTKTGCMNEVTVTTERDEYFADTQIIWGDPTTEVNETVNVKDISDLFSEVDLGSVTAPNGDQFTYTNDFAWEDYDECGSYRYDNTATIVETDQSALATLKVNVQCEFFKGETAWAANGDVPLQLRYTSRGNWATYVQYEYPEKTTTLFAGQTIPVGTVNFLAVNGNVTITVEMSAPWEFEAVSQNLKVQDYSSAPSGNPSPGRFAHKKACNSVSSTCSIEVPNNNFYGVHVNVGKWFPDPNFGPQE